MDYKEKAAILRACSIRKGERCNSCPAFGQGARNCAANAKRDGAKAITDLLARAEAAENRCETLEKIVKEYQEVIVPGFRERAEKAEQELAAAVKELDESEWRKKEG